jgi:hypothetical protein
MRTRRSHSKRDSANVSFAHAITRPLAGWQYVPLGSMFTPAGGLRIAKHERDVRASLHTELRASALLHLFDHQVMIRVNAQVRCDRKTFPYHFFG